MSKKEAIQVFEDRQVRTVWDAGQEKWYLSVVDIIAVLTDSPNPRKYWSVLKTRLKAEGSELATNCSQLKMQSSDGKYYKTDVADTEQWEHIINDIRLNGSDNIALCCWSCNASKGRKKLEDWLKSKYCFNKSISAENVAPVVKRHLDAISDTNK